MSARAVGTLQEIFEARVEKTDSCWIWIGAIGHGYGILRLLSRGIYDYAHRISVRLDGRDIPDGMHVDHLCRNTRCVNPAHLEVVTPAVNLARGLMRQRSQEHFASRTHCAHGHPWNEENTYRNSRGYRNCRACHRERARGRPDRKAAKEKAS